MKQNKFFLVRLMIPEEEMDMMLDASAMLVEITPEDIKLIKEAGNRLKGFNRKFGGSEITIPSDPFFLAPGEADSLMGYDDEQTDESDGDYYDFDDRVFSESAVIAINDETFNKGEAMWRENHVRMYACQMHISTESVRWTAGYKYKDGCVLSEHIPLKKLL